MSPETHADLKDRMDSLYASNNSIAQTAREAEVTYRVAYGHLGLPKLGFKTWGAYSANLNDKKRTSPLYRAFSEFLRAHLKSVGTPVWLAGQIGTNPANVRMYLSGKTLPTSDTLELIFAALGMDVPLEDMGTTLERIVDDWELRNPIQ